MDTSTQTTLAGTNAPIETRRFRHFAIAAIAAAALAAAFWAWWSRLPLIRAAWKWDAAKNSQGAIEPDQSKTPEIS